MIDFGTSGEKIRDNIEENKKGQKGTSTGDQQSFLFQCAVQAIWAHHLESHIHTLQEQKQENHLFRSDVRFYPENIFIDKLESTKKTILG